MNTCEHVLSCITTSIPNIVNRVQFSPASAGHAEVLVIFCNYAVRLDFLKLMGVALTLRT